MDGIKVMDEIKKVIEIKNVTKDYGDFKIDNISENKSPSFNTFYLSVNKLSALNQFI